MVTFLGTGCSGSGSFFPALGMQRNHNTVEDYVSLRCPCYATFGLQNATFYTAYIGGKINLTLQVHRFNSLR